MPIVKKIYFFSYRESFVNFPPGVTSVVNGKIFRYSILKLRLNGTYPLRPASMSKITQSDTIWFLQFWSQKCIYGQSLFKIKWLEIVFNLTLRFKADIWLTLHENLSFLTKKPCSCIINKMFIFPISSI